jgi:ATP-dependent Clp protease ATP-binding subunit ClpC
MPKINVYLPDDLAAAVKAAGVPVSPVCQRALAEAVQAVNHARKGIAASRDPGLDPARLAQLGERLEGRMTDRLRHVLDSAARAGSPIRTRDLLLGLLEEEGNLALRILQASGHDVDDLRAAAADAAGVVGTSTSGGPGASGGSGATGTSTSTSGGSGTSTSGTSTSSGSGASGASGDEPMDPIGTVRGPGEPGATDGTLWTNLTRPAKDALAATLEASVELGHNYLGCEHLLIGLLHDPDTTAGHVLRGLGVEAAEVRRAVTAAVAGHAHAKQSSPAPAGLEELLSRQDAIERRLSTGGL